MPLILLDRLPLPKLKTYVLASLLALSGCIYFAIRIINEGNQHGNNNNNTSNNTAVIDNPNLSNTSMSSSSLEGVLTLGQWIYQVFFIMIKEPICVWTMINMAFCCLVLIGRCIQRLVFGELRVSERQHLKDKFWNFVFYKFIFVFGVINVQFIDEVLLWCSWFASLGFLHLLSLLGKDRFEYLSFSPTTPLWNHVKLLALLTTILALSGFMLLVAVCVGLFGGFNTFAFMSAEVILLAIRTLHVILRYILHLYEMRREHTADEPRPQPTTTITDPDASEQTSAPSSPQTSPPPLSAPSLALLDDRRGYAIYYYLELTFELSTLAIDLVHHVHMLLWSNIFLSMASLVICMQLRYLFHEIQLRYKRHKNYLLVRRHLEATYPMATRGELATNSDNCAICWDRMDTARKLPCSHLFHNKCLQSWLEQDTSCPTCRLALNVQGPDGGGGGGGGANGGVGGGGAMQSDRDHRQSSDIESSDVMATRTTTNAVHHHNRQLNHFFHFDGSRYVSWFPSFSVEVSHAHHLLRSPDHHHRGSSSSMTETIAANSQLDAMARQVQQLFPHLPIAIILDDLRATRSVELTIENVLESRLNVLLLPPPHPSPRRQQQQATVSSTPTNLLRQRSQATSTRVSVATTTTDSSSTSSTLDCLPLNLLDVDDEEEVDAASILEGNATLSQEHHSNGGCSSSRFSKSSIERERILQRRKEQLIQAARKRYIQRQKNNVNINVVVNSNSSSTNETLISTTTTTPLSMSSSPSNYNNNS